MDHSERTWALYGLLHVTFSGFESLLDYQFVNHTQTPLEEFPKEFGRKTIGGKISALRALVSTHPSLADTVMKAEALFADSKRNTFAHGRIFTSENAGGVKAVNARTYPVSPEDVVDMTRTQFSDFCIVLSKAVHSFQVELGISEEALVTFVRKVTSTTK
jgi:hypothetical protein